MFKPLRARHEVTPNFMEAQRAVALHAQTNLEVHECLYLNRCCPCGVQNLKTGTCPTVSTFVYHVAVRDCFVAEALTPNVESPLSLVVFAYIRGLSIKIKQERTTKYQHSS